MVWRTASAQTALLELQTANCWCSTAGGTVQLEYWQGITTELRNALSTSCDAFLLSKHMTYSITAASQGSVILPSLVDPNSSWDILRSSPKILEQILRNLTQRIEDTNTSIGASYTEKANTAECFLGLV